MYGPTPKISISTSTPGPLPADGTTTKVSIEPPYGIAIVSVRAGRATPGNLIVFRPRRAGNAVPVPRVIVALLAPAAAVLAAAAGPAVAAPPIKHVFVITLENKGFDETFGPAS